MKRLARVRWLSTGVASKAPNLALADEKAVKSFHEIEKEMAQKSNSYRRELHRKNSKASISKIRLDYQSMKDQFSLGDAIMIGSLVYAVVKMPTNFQDPIIVCDAKGVTKQVWPAMVTARLANLIPSKSEILTNCLNKDQTAVSGSVYEHFGFPLGSLQNDALAIARELVPKVLDIILLLQRNVPVTVSLYDFFALVLKLKDTDLSEMATLDWPQPIDEYTPELTPEFILAMRMVFDDYLIRNKVRLEFGYTKLNIVVIKSLETEKEHVDIVNKNTTKTRNENKVPKLFVTYVKDYALDNLSTTDPQSMGIAVQILRSVGQYSDESLDKHHAFEWVNKYGLLRTDGPFLDRDAYQWFAGEEQVDQPKHKQPEQPTIGQIAAAADDKLEKLRVKVTDPVWCIDSDDTTEVDDGISITTKGNIACVQVHIANLTCAFKDPKPLIDAVYARTTTVYMPQRKIAMLPEEFAQVYSLSNGSPALTVIMEFNTQTGERLSTRIQPSTLQNVKRVNYKHVEDIISKNHATGALKDLYDLSNTFYNTRLAKNAVVNLLMQNSPKVLVDASGAVQMETEKTPRATQLVTELMLQANAAVAQFTHENNIPCIYRFNSLSFYTEDQRQEFFNQKLIGFEWMPAMRASVQSTSPQPHSLTGLDSYSWFTSPLRRSQDLLLHMQLEAYLLQKEFPLSTKKLNNMIPWISASQSLTKLFQRQIDRYYSLKYLEGRQGAVVTGYPQQTDRDTNTQTIYIPEFGVSAELHYNRNPVGPGPRSFTIGRVSAIIDLLQVSKFGAKL